MFWYGFVLFVFFAVVNQRYEPEVQSPGGFLNNNVLFRCSVPSFVKEHVSVTSWLQQPAFNIYPSTISGKYGLSWSEKTRRQKTCPSLNFPQTRFSFLKFFKKFSGSFRPLYFCAFWLRSFPEVKERKFFRAWQSFCILFFWKIWIFK